MISRSLALAVPISGILASFALPPIHILPFLVALSYPIARMLSCQNMTAPQRTAGEVPERQARAKATPQNIARNDGRKNMAKGIIQ